MIVWIGKSMPEVMPFPEGSPKSFYKGTDPTGTLPASVDFALIKYDEPESFAALLFGDTQPYSEQAIKEIGIPWYNVMGNLSAHTHFQEQHRIEVRAKDRFHRTSVQQSVYRIE
jgi:hypothetical protein